MRYQYKCHSCDLEFEIVVPAGFFTANSTSTAGDLPDCPQCKNNYNISRVWYTPNIIFKGTGWTLNKGELSRKNDRNS